MTVDNPEPNAAPTGTPAPEPSTSIGQDLQDMLNAEPGPNNPPAPVGDERAAQLQADLEKAQARIDNLLETQGRMGQELGDYRKAAEGGTGEQTGAVQEMTAEEMESLMFKDPKAFAVKLREQVRSEIKSELEPQMAPIRHQNFANVIAQENPLAARLFNDEETMAWVADQAKDPNAIASYQDLERLQIEAAMFRAAGRKFVNEQKVVADAGKPDRPENAGLASPSTQAGGGGAPTGGETVEDRARAGKLTPQEAFEEFSKRAAAL